MNFDSERNAEKTVVLVNRAMYLPGEGGYKRTMYLYDLMRNLGHRPVLLTSDFNHYKKEQRDTQLFYKDHPDYSDIVFLHTRPYQKNISVRRRLAEADWTRAVKKWVRDNAEHIDVIMLSMPDMNTILAISPICRSKKIEIVIDVRDLRPEAFRVLVPNQFLYEILTLPMKIKANQAYRCADKLYAVSQEYLDRGSVKGSHATVKKAVYIGSDLKKFDKGSLEYASEVCKPEDELWVSYAGTLGTSYDLVTLIDAAGKLNAKEFSGKTIKVIILGQGPERADLERHAQAIGASNVSFLGFMEYERMAAFLTASDITVNAIKSRASQSIINKVSDYFAAGKPMLNSCSSKEQREMVDQYHVGINYEAENIDSLVDAISILAKDENLRSEMGRNARLLAESLFDRDRSYREMAEEIYE